MSTPLNMDITINDLYVSTRDAIFKKFNMKSSIGGDFRTFARRLNMSTDDITTISENAENPTEEIFKWWGKKDDATVKNLLEILKEMKRDDIIRIIRKDPYVQGREPGAIGVKARETSKDEVDRNASCISKNRVTSSHPKPSTHNCPSPPHVDVIKIEDMKPDDMDWDEVNRSPIDVLLVVNENEFRAFYGILPEPKVADFGTKLAKVLFATIEKNRVALVRSGMGAGGKGGAQATVMEAINLLNPKVILFAGVCFGMKDNEQKFADILVSKKVGTYAAVQVNDDGDDDQRGVVHECDRRLCKLFSDTMGWKGVSPQDKSLQKPNVHSGLIISGPQLIDNKIRKEYLKKKYPAALGGEMEGEGLYNICDDKKVPWIVCKAICDWADGTKNKKWQLYAAAVAASFVKHVLTNSYVPERKRKSGADQVDSESSSPKRTKTTASKRTKTSASKRTKTTAS